ncbi:MAG TPA: LemA family protein [Candidatus Paceibacterota bacterium]|nr:LemA family protein [Candidatus Paceibacterota bacterium]
MTAFYIIIAIIVVAVLALILFYNHLVRLRNHAEEAWADIDVQLKRRYDLIPNLVNTVKGYAAHEQGTFEKVTAARTAAMNAGTVAEKAQAENQLTGALKSLFAVSESYPDLKASQNFLELQQELSDTENKIQAARRFYNSNVLALQNALEAFPGNVFASSFGFTTKDFFQLEENAAEKEPVKVSF